MSTELVDTICRDSAAAYFMLIQKISQRIRCRESSLSRREICVTNEPTKFPAIRYN